MPDALPIRHLDVTSDLVFESQAGKVKIYDVDRREIRIDVENKRTLRALIKTFNPSPGLLLKRHRWQPWIDRADVRFTLYVGGAPWGGVSPKKGVSFDVLALAWQYLLAKLS